MFTSGKPEKQQQRPSNYNPETEKAANKKVNGISDNATTIARYTYDDAEGVVNTRVHELSKLLTQTTYSYDERVRLDSIITKNLTVTPSSPELMKHLYHYDGSVPLYGGQYMPQSGLSYNGNINAVLSSYNFSGVYGSAPSQFNYATVYGYKYDRLNRLTDADGFVGDFVVAAMALGTNPTIAAVQIGDERYTYDKIGNIKELSRTVRHSDPMNTMIVSKAEGWNYYYNGFNKLTQVNGFPGTTTRTYTYDKNGNLLTDSYREIAATEYGRTAYPYYLEADNNKIAYLYSVDDQRMYKKVDSPTETTTEFYLQDATGKTVALRRKVGSAAATWEYYVNGSEREARIKNVTHNGMIAAQEIEFYLYDHLGNTRIVYEPTYAGGVLELAIHYVADYFPYGKVLREYVNTSTGDPEKFLTTQHERDKETGLDYRGARFYDSDVARFLSIDPMQIARLHLTPYNYVSGNPIMRIDPTGKLDDNHYINKDGSVQTVKTDDNFDRFYTQNSADEGGYTLEATLTKNAAGLVNFPESGNGFSRYGMVDAGGQSTNPSESVGQGDHYLKPETAAALFGVISELRGKGITISLGDMSSSNGSDPWQAGQKHHAGHGHYGKRSGLDADFRYINHSGVSFQSQTATSSSSFSVANNTAVYDAANRFGFTKNYQGTSGILPGITKVGGHNDHGHLGLDYNNFNWKYVSTAPTNPSIRQQFLSSPF